MVCEMYVKEIKGYGRFHLVIGEEVKCLFFDIVSIPFSKRAPVCRLSRVSTPKLMLNLVPDDEVSGSSRIPGRKIHITHRKSIDERRRVSLQPSLLPFLGPD